MPQEAGLSNVKEREVGLWRGLHEDPALRIVVHKLMKPARAPIVVAGEYAVTDRSRSLQKPETTRHRGSRPISRTDGRGLLRRLVPDFSR